MSGNKKGMLIALLILVLVGIHLTQMFADPQYLALVKRNKTNPHSNRLMVQLPAQFMVGCYAGFREVIAAALWIRADDFFHEGDYTAIVPIVRLVTWLDPHNIDAFTTGAWHLDYNFVDDKNQMSDKRYIPASIALLKEGIKANPHIYDLYFELGWTHYNKKLRDYKEAAKWIKKACQYGTVDPNTGAPEPRPLFVDRMLAHMYEKCGEINKAIDQWKVCLKQSQTELKKKQDDPQDVILCERNLMMLYLRDAWRYGNMVNYRKGLDLAAKLIKGKRPAVLPWAYEGALKDYEERMRDHDPPHDVLKPLDAHFHVTWKKVAPKVFMIKGSINLVPISEYKGLASECFTHRYEDNLKMSANRRVQWEDGCRVRWRIEDLGYKMPTLKTFNWKINTSQTIIWGSIYVGGGHFSTLMDLSDPKFADMFPFKAKKYLVTIWFDPAEPGAPDYVQDRIGWRGEALTDKHYLDTTTKPGFHLIRKQFILDRKDIM